VSQVQGDADVEPNIPVPYSAITTQTGNYIVSWPKSNGSEMPTANVGFSTGLENGSEKT